MCSTSASLSTVPALSLTGLTTTQTCTGLCRGQTQPPFWTLPYMKLKDVVQRDGCKFLIMDSSLEASSVTLAYMIILFVLL